MSNEIVGEGTYGCVTKPSLACKRRKNEGFDSDDHRAIES